jgi:glucokinase
MLLAGDVGGTKTLLGLFDPSTGRRPAPISLHTYATADYPSFAAILDAFARDLRDASAASVVEGPDPSAVRTPAPSAVEGSARRVVHGIEAAAVGVAGPVVGASARLTNIPWDISAAEIAAACGTSRVQLMNDLEAMANSVDVLEGDELAVLQEGVPRADGNAAVIAAGTGLGQAYLHRHGEWLVPVPSEGGHADFAARTDREIELVRMLREQYGRAEIEQVVSGPGLLNIYRFTHRSGECDMLEGGGDPAARVSQAGLTGRCQPCVEALRMFVSAFGAEAGNLALRGVATAGLYVGSGIAPKILPMLKGNLFMEAFLAKAPMNELIARIPVRIILNPNAGLVGAAVRAQELATE